MNKLTQKILVWSISPLLALGIAMGSATPTFAQQDTGECKSVIATVEHSSKLAAERSCVLVDEPSPNEVEGDGNGDKPQSPPPGFI